MPSDFEAPCSSVEKVKEQKYLRLENGDSDSFIYLFILINLFLAAFFFKFFFKFIYLWLCWVFISVHGLSLVTASGGYSWLRCAGFSSRWLLL